ncbi:MAG: class I SAM-dependent methyltransferase [Anaerolineae bacterium]
MNYYQHSTQRIELGGEDLIVYSKPGMVAWNDVAAAHMLLAEDTDFAPGMRALVLESPALAIYLARMGAEAHLYADSLISLRMAKLMADLNKVTLNIHEAAYPADANHYDVAFMLNPKGRAYASLLITAAQRALKPGGRLFFCGAKAEGAQAIATDAGDIFATAPITVRVKAHQRLSAVRKHDDAGTPQPLPQPAAFDCEGLTCYTLPGVFSREGVDAGTAMLLSTLDESACAGKRVLDVGCGSGVLGMLAAKCGAAQVELSDVSLLALDCARQGVNTNGLDAVCVVIASDLYSALADDARYDLILSNPPFHAGHSVDTAAAEALIGGARERLAQGGALRLVANRFLAYNKVMQKVFSKVNVVTEDTRYWVLEGCG